MAQLNGKGNKLGKYQQMSGQGREAFIEKYVDVSGNIPSSTADGVPARGGRKKPLTTLRQPSYGR